jgi:hypothetical protein
VSAEDARLAAALDGLHRLAERGAALQDRFRQADAEIRAMLPAPDDELVRADVDDEGRLVTLTIAPDAPSRCTARQLEDAINAAIAYRTGPVRSLVGGRPETAAALLAALAAGALPPTRTYPYGDGSVAVDAVLGRPGRVRLTEAFVTRSDATTIAATVMAAHAAAAAASAARDEGV